MAIVFWGYEKDNFGGKWFAESANRDIRDIRDLDFPNDQLSSFKIAADTEVYMYADKDYGGAVYHFYGPMVREKATDWPNDQISSFKVRPLGLSDEEKVSCYTGDNVPLLDRCGSWAKNGALNEGFMRNYCASPAAAISGTCVSRACQKWCDEHRGECDQTMIQFCDANPGNPLCTCIKSPAQTKLIGNPLCFDQKCQTTGYATKNMKESPCPSYIDCSIQANLINSGVSISQGMNIDQNCGNVAGKPVEPAPVNADESGPNLSTYIEKIKAETPLNKALIALSVLFLLILIIGALALVMAPAPASLGAARLDQIPQSRVRSY